MPNLHNQNRKPFGCSKCTRRFTSEQGAKDHMRDKHKSKFASREQIEPDWEGECEVCGQSPVVPLTGLCGPCTFGEADTVGGNW